MRLATFCIHNGEPRLGAYAGPDAIVDLASAAERGGRSSCVLQSMQSLIDAGGAGLHSARAALEAPCDAVFGASDVTLLAPLPRPRQVRDFLCFEEHMRNSAAAAARLRAMMAGPEAPAVLVDANPPAIAAVWYRQPIYYKCNRFAVAGPGADVHAPRYSRVLDYELELAAVIGKQGRDIAADVGAEHIFGYTIFNDFTARDAQMVEMAGLFGPAKGKDFDGANILGPCIVTADEVPDPYNLRMRAWINGELWSDGNSGSIHWSFPQMIAHLSQDETLYPGEVIGSGTVGNGCGLESLRSLVDGDIVTLEIEHIGRLTNRVVGPHLISLKELFHDPAVR